MGWGGLGLLCAVRCVPLSSELSSVQARIWELFGEGAADIFLLPPEAMRSPFLLAPRHCLLLLGERSTLLSSLHGKSLLQAGGVITTRLGETPLALI